MSQLIPLNLFKAHLRLTHDEEDLTLFTYLEQATAIVLGFIARPSDEAWSAEIAGWTEITVPEPVHTAMCCRRRSCIGSGRLGRGTAAASRD